MKVLHKLSVNEDIKLNHLGPLKLFLIFRKDLNKFLQKAKNANEPKKRFFPGVRILKSCFFEVKYSKQKTN